MRYLLAIALVFSFIGIANADAIPTVVDAKNQPTVWTQTVYTAAAIPSGYVCEWVHDDCTTTGYVDMCPWVHLSDTADSPWTAGVTPIDNNIAAASTFDMIIKGPAFVMDAGNTVSQNTFVSSHSDGTVIDETCNATDEAILGVCIQNTALGTRSDLGNYISIIYVDPTPYENGE